MRRITTTALLLTASLGVTGAATAQTGGGWLVRAVVVQCHRAASDTDRFVVFAGRMRAIKGTARMSVKFDLLQRTATSAGFVAVDGGSSTGESDPPAPTIYRYKAMFRNLTAPALYKGRATFSWLDASGKVIRQIQRTTGPCIQPDPRPNLVVGQVRSQKAGQGQRRYFAAIRNDGLGTAGSFDVALSVNGKALVPVTIASLPARSRQVVSFVGPACGANGSLRITVDPDNRVAEGNEADDAKTVACPVQLG
ncbi:MAG TPA: CARDB domain-containing protein [Solirubrobacteraceae bacterium]|jgi:hypothetical protein